MNVRPSLGAALLVASAACSSGPPVPSSEFDRSSGYVEVAIDDDGFVFVGERRLPIEALVLELRQATRGMTLDERMGFVVKLRFADPSGDEASAREARKACDFLLAQLEIMGVRQIEYL